MARIRTFCIAALVAAFALAVLAGTASAAVPAANAKFCKAAESIGDSQSSQPTKAEAAQAVKGFENAAKYAPGKVKSALKTIAKFLGTITSADSPGDLAKLYTGDGFKNYTKSLTTYVKYYTAQCFGTS
jgi:hypothetical protein